MNTCQARWVWLLSPICVGTAVLLFAYQGRGVEAPSTTLTRAADPSTNAARVPVALDWGPHGRIYVALRDAKAIAVVDPSSWKLERSWPLPVRPVCVRDAGDRHTLLVGSLDGDLLVVEPEGQIKAQTKLARGPLNIVPLPNGRALVSSRWDPGVNLVDWHSGKILQQHALPLQPGAMLRLPDGQVIVAAAFRGQLARLQPEQPGSFQMLNTFAVNVKGFAVSGDQRELLFAHQVADHSAQVTRTGIDWGLVMSSKLSAFRLTAFDDPTAYPRNERRLTLDGSGHGAADPSALVVSPDGTKVIIALAGAHKLLKIDRTQGPQPAADLLPIGDSQKIVECDVGRSPVALLHDPEQGVLITADSMSDSLTVVRFDDLNKIATVSLGPSDPQPTAEQRGEAWFHDGRAAFDRWMTCASCHPSGHTIALNFDTLGDGDYGAAKNTPTLLGIAATEPFTWTGRFPTLAGQVHQSFSTSLHNREVQVAQVDDVVAYLQSLVPPPPKRPASDPAVARGALVFEKNLCADCHTPPLFTSDQVIDVGLTEPYNKRRPFNPPSLRGVGWSAPYFHDGRARRLIDVLEIHHPGHSEAPSPQDRADLAAFLESL